MGSSPAARKYAVHAVKRLWGYGKDGCRNPARNATRLFSPFALVTLHLVRRQRLLSLEGGALRWPRAQ